MNTNLIPEVTFHPWVGENYGSPSSLFQKKVLILGGSHYGESGEEYPTFTEDVVRLYFDDECKDGWKSTYSKFINSVYLKESSREEKQQFFDSVIFYNYLQEFAGTEPDEASEYDYCEQHHYTAFLSVIEEYKPDVVIAWGKHVWEALPNNWGYGDAEQDSHHDELGEVVERCYTYPFQDDHKVTLLGVTHPSGGYSWKPHFDKFEALNIYK